MTLHANAPLVVAKDKGGLLRYYYAGDPIAYLSPEDEERLLDDGLVVDVEDVLVAPESEPVVLTPAVDGEVARPKQTADKDDWVAYAIARGIPEAEAKAMTKPQLIAAVTTE